MGYVLTASFERYELLKNVFNLMVGHKNGRMVWFSTHSNYLNICFGFELMILYLINVRCFKFTPSETWTVFFFFFFNNAQSSYLTLYTFKEIKSWLINVQQWSSNEKRSLDRDLSEESIESEMSSLHICLKKNKIKKID